MTQGQQKHIEDKLAKGFESGELKPETTFAINDSPPLLRKISEKFPNDRMLGWNKAMDSVFVYSVSKWFTLNKYDEVIEGKA